MSLAAYIPGRVVIDERKGIVHRETEELDVVKAVVERVIGQQREGQREGRFAEEGFTDGSVTSAVGPHLLLQKVALPEQLFLASAGKPQGPCPDEQLQLFGADGRTLDEVGEGTVGAATLAVGEQPFDGSQLKALHMDEADPGILSAGGWCNGRSG